MNRPGVKFAAELLVATMLAAPAAFADASPKSVVPGVVNYVEGQVAIGDQALDAKSIGSAQLQSGESLTTRQGRAEVLLTPGVFLRLDDHSSLEMVSPSLSQTEVALDRGEALVEVNEIHPENDLGITVNGITTHLLKTGLYDFDAERGLVRVLEGKAIAGAGDRGVTIKAGWQLGVNENEAPIPARFDTKYLEATDLYRWSSLRSKYLAEANVDTARRYYLGGWYGPDGYGPGWYGAGWYWDPWHSAYTFVPADGVFYDTFGWTYYSPPFAHRIPGFHRVDHDRNFAGRPDPQAQYPGRDHDQWGGRRGHPQGFGRRR